MYCHNVDSCLLSKNQIGNNSSLKRHHNFEKQRAAIYFIFKGMFFVLHSLLHACLKACGKFPHLIILKFNLMARNNSRRGFASMDPEERREIASRGGRASHDDRRNYDDRYDDDYNDDRRVGRSRYDEEDD